MSEEWRPIPGYKGYEASSLGRIRSRFKVLSQNLTRGYFGCQLSTCRRRVNRLVCAAFHGMPPAGNYDAAHLDGDKTNNKPENLAWKTPWQNKQDVVRHGSMKGENNPRARITEVDVKDIRQKRLDGWKLDEIHRCYPSISRSMVAYIYQRKTWTHI